MKKLISIIVVSMMLFSSTIMASAETAKIVIDGQSVQYTESSGEPFVDSANRTQVPFRQTLESFGATVKWDSANNMAIAEKYGVTVKVPIGANYIYKDGVKIQNDTAALLKDGRTYLPIRAVLQAFGLNVGWDNTTKSVVVSSASITVADTVATTGGMTVHFIDVGQGDSILIDNGEYEILIDAGNNKDGKNVVSYINPYIDGDLEYIIATHPDADHIGGLDDVINTYSVDNIIDSGDTSKTTVTYKDYYTAATTEPNCNFTYDQDMTIDIGDGASLQIIETGDGYTDVNDNSIVSLLKYNNVRVLLTGDMEAAAEATSMYKYSDVDVLKAAHHGSRTSSTSGFLNTVKPEYVVISAGLDNIYGHPHAEALQRYFDIGATVYGTFKFGTIVLTTDGNTYSFNTDIKVTGEDAGHKNTTTQTTTTPTTTTQTVTNTTNISVTQAEAVYVGNSNTKKYHRLECRYVSSISADHIVYFKTEDAAVSQGYVPCKVCNP